MAVIAVAIPDSGIASAPICRTHNGAPYCQYDGYVAKAYINVYGQVLLYYDTPLDLSEPASVGISGISSTAAAAFSLDENLEFGRSLYATLLSAQSRGAKITVQMRDRVGGYLRIDRIWIHED